LNITLSSARMRPYFGPLYTNLHSSQTVTDHGGVYSVSQKSNPLKLFGIFSLLVNLYNWKLSWFAIDLYSYVYTNFGLFHHHFICS